MKATYQRITQGDTYKQLSKTKFTILFISLSTSSSFNAREAMAVLCQWLVVTVSKVVLLPWESDCKQPWLRSHAYRCVPPVSGRPRLVISNVFISNDTSIFRTNGIAVTSRIYRLLSDQSSTFNWCSDSPPAMNYPLQNFGLTSSFLCSNFGLRFCRIASGYWRRIHIWTRALHILYPPR